MLGRPYGVIAVREMTGKVKNTLPDVLSTIIRKEDGFQGGKLTEHPVAKAKTMTLLVMYKLDHLGFRRASSEVDEGYSESSWSDADRAAQIRGEGLRRKMWS